MECPSCHYLNDATSVRCIQCSTVLIPEALGRSPEVQAKLERRDSRMFGRIGAMIGFVVVYVLLKFVLAELWVSERRIVGFALVGAAIGGLIGLHYAKHGRRQ